MQSTNPIHSPRATSPIQPRANAPKDVRAEIQLILNELPQKAIQRANKLINKLEAIRTQCQMQDTQRTSKELSQFIGCEYYNTTLLVKVDCILKVVRVLLAELSSDNSLQTQDLGIMQQGADNKTHLTSIQNAVAAALHEMIAAQPEVYYGSCEHRKEIRGRWEGIWELLHTDMLISYKQYEKLALMIEAKLHAELFYGFARKVSEIAVLPLDFQGWFEEGMKLQQSSKTLLQLRLENGCFWIYPDKELMAQDVACVEKELEAMSKEQNADLELVTILKTRLQLEIINRDAWELRKEEVAMKSHPEMSPERREAFFTTLAKFREHAKIKVVDNAPVGQDFYRNVVHARLMEIHHSHECCVANFTRGTGIELHTTLRELSIGHIKNIVECSSARYTKAALGNLMRANKTAHDICGVWEDNIDMIHDDSALFIYRNIVNAYQALCDACNHKLEVLRSKHLGNIKDASTLQLIDNDKWFEYRKALDLSVVPLVIKFVHKTKSRVISGLLEYLDIKPQDVHEISPIIDGLLKAVIAPTQFSVAQKKAVESALRVFHTQTLIALSHEQFTKAAYYLEITEFMKRELNPAHCFNIADYQLALNA